jgi:carboxyl-terminal processing protease
VSKKKKIFLSSLIVLIVFVTSWVFPNEVYSSFENKAVEDIFIDEFQNPLFWSLYFIGNFYYGKDNIDYDKILESTIEGMVSGLDDPFAWYLDASEVEESKIETEAKYGGLGLTIRYDSEKKVVVVVSPMNGTPAHRAGFMPNDYILSINGVSTSELGLQKSASLMRGEPGTEVTLEIYREGWIDSKTVTLVREIIETKTVKYDVVEYQDRMIGYILLTNFAETSAQEMKEALEKLSKQTIEGVILDVRNNPGGLLNTAIDISSMFLKTGKIVSLRYYDGTEEIIPSKPGYYNNFLENIPLVLLVNTASASASEILAGALKDNEAATLIGETTYGKAAVQRPFQLSTGGEIWLPIARYFTPNGTDINLKGITPHIEVKNPPREVISLTSISEEEAQQALYTTTDKPILHIKDDIQLKTALDFIVSGGK